MNRRMFYAVLVCWALLWTQTPLLGAAARAVQPNILLIVADDLGFGDLGCYGATLIKTPNLDRMAAEGLRFTAGYAPSSTCTPTRYSILTGEYAWRQPAKKTGILDGDAPLCIEPGRVTLPAMLRKAGYTTGVVGKWHLGLGDGQVPVNFNEAVKPGPLEVGFDYCHIIPATVDRVPSVWIENHRVVGLNPADPIVVSYLTNISNEPTGLQRPDLLNQPADEQHSGTIINGISRIGFMKGGKSARFNDEELTSTLVRKTVGFLEQNKSRRFFLSIGLFEPHVPRVAEPLFKGKGGCGVRGDVIQQLDWAVGKILDTIERLGLAKSTLVIFTSDNGPVLFDGYFDKSVEDANGHRPADGLRGWKYLIYEGGCRVPLLVRWPGHVKPGTSDQMFNLVDLLASLGRISGGLVPRSGSDSMDLSAVLLDGSARSARDHTVLHGLSGSLAIREGDWKFIPPNAKGPVTGMGRGANPSDTRFAESRITEPLLFNLRADKAEKTNVFAQNPEIGRRLEKRLEQIKGGGARTEGQ